MKIRITLLLVLTFSLFTGRLMAHEPNHSYLFLKIYEKSIEGRIEITAAEINRELNTSINEEIVEAEVNSLIPSIQKYFLSNLSFSSAENKYPVLFTETEMLPLDDEADNVVFHFTLDGVNEIPESLVIKYAAFFEKKSDHKGVLIIEHNWKSGTINNHLQVTDIFTSSKTETTLSTGDDNLLKGFIAMVKLGMWHIWIGLDHILFLVALILPSVIRRNENKLENSSSKWIPVGKFKPAFLYILGIVTAFTVAHSITLAIAALGLVDLSSRYVESIIALSIALAALHNIKPIFHSKEWIIALLFGLFHGFGFASVLGEKGLAGEFVSLSLLGFNVGVEIGQVLIVAGIFPILYLIRKTKFYPKLLIYGSIVLILISIHWVIERFFEVNIPLGRFLDSFL
ncbi:MAG: HupE/UreJ family protein [Flavobacteriales bacterium]|nr:HupE/UreJ family protein [Flavobacteriales bacterium]